MAHESMAEMLSMKEKKGRGKIMHININVAENGYTYRAETDRMERSKEYVYETAEGVVKALKDDLLTPHLREYKKKDKGLMAEQKRTRSK